MEITSSNQFLAMYRAMERLAGKMAHNTTDPAWRIARAGHADTVAERIRDTARADRRERLGAAYRDQRVWRGSEWERQPGQYTGDYDENFATDRPDGIGAVVSAYESEMYRAAGVQDAAQALEISEPARLAEIEHAMLDWASRNVNCCIYAEDGFLPRLLAEIRAARNVIMGE